MGLWDDLVGHGQTGTRNTGDLDAKGDSKYQKYIRSLSHLDFAGLSSVAGVLLKGRQSYDGPELCSALDAVQDALAKNDEAALRMALARAQAALGIAFQAADDASHAIASVPHDVAETAEVLAKKAGEAVKNLGFDLLPIAIAIGIVAGSILLLK